MTPRTTERGEPEWLAERRLAAEGHLEHLADLAPVDRLGPDRVADESPDAGGDEDSATSAFRHNREILADQGVVLCSLATAVVDHAELVEPHLATIAASSASPYAALNTVRWTGGSFVYVPPGVEAAVPLQAHPRSSPEPIAPFERTLIVAGDGASVHYIEGCSAPIYTTETLRAPVTEVVVGRGATVTHTTIQNWSTNVHNVVTKRAVVEADGRMAWITGNIGGRRTVSRPAIELNGRGASGEVIAVSYAGRDQHQDGGVELVHRGGATTATIVAKSVVEDGGRCGFGGAVTIEPGADGSTSVLDRDILSLDDSSIVDDEPLPIVDGTGNGGVGVSYRPTVTVIDDEQLRYLMSRGLSRDESVAVVVNGFVEPVTRTLPLEYAVEWTRLIELQLQGSVG